jgi:hypothetical protein
MHLVHRIAGEREARQQVNAVWADAGVLTKGGTWGQTREHKSHFLDDHHEH